MKCADCLHWADWDYAGSLYHPPRDCQHPDLGALPLDEEGISPRNIITLPSFGCVKFEPKGKAEDARK